MTVAHGRLHRMGGPGSLSCFYCGTHAPCACQKAGAGSEIDGATLDHIIPTCRGGSNDPANLVTACRRCNSAKSYRIWPDEWFPGHEAQTWLTRTSVPPLCDDSLAVLGVIHLLSRLPDGRQHLREVISLTADPPSLVRNKLDNLVDQGRLARLIVSTGSGASAFEHIYGSRSPGRRAA